MKRKMFLRFEGLGDDLFVNTLAYHYWREHGKRVIVAGKKHGLFRGNPGVWILPTHSRNVAHKFGRLMEELHLIESMTYLEYQTNEEQGGMKPMKGHIFQVLAEKVGISEAPKKPVLFLSEKEIKRTALPSNGKPWVAIHSTGVTKMTENKNWYLDRFELLASEIRKKYRVVQLGMVSDPVLENDLDLRGQKSPRDAAAVLASCSALVCQVGYLMHAAAAVGTRSVVIYGGFEAPWESGYEQNINLFSKLDCSPCWLRKPCVHDKECMKKITVADMLDGLKKVLEVGDENQSF
ncbi:MAG: glycosyltransferase family 9 protein [Kiritimatiellae bacterium]|nr:glycosyltransferase family 9 protein [Kiritimatiellia bacterium]